MNSYSLTHLSDAVLLRNLRIILARNGQLTAALLAHLGEVDARRLYAPAGFSSMFAYCLRELRFAEGPAWRRIQAARAARRFPVLFEAVAEGRIHLTAVCLIAPHLTPGNIKELLRAVGGRSRAEVQEWLASRFPQAASVPPLASIRAVALPLPKTVTLDRRGDMFESPAPPSFLPPLAAVKSETTVAVIRHDLDNATVESAAVETSTTNVTCAAEVESAAVPACASPADPAPAPDAGENETTESLEATTSPPRPPSFLVQVTVSKGTHDKLRLAQALLSHAVSPRDVAQVLDRALDALIEKLEKRKFGKLSH
ncbi:MAG TPA: hypothetical protein VFM00_00260 [Candidatus Eisenbacteria bacterium]|nr:hypothetical protein [Candidatus Eisenbacteria bacterium]